MFNRPTNNNAVSTSGTFNGVFSNNSTFQGGTYSGNAAGLTNLFGNDVVMSFSIYTNQNWGKSNWFSPGGSAFGVPTNGNGPANTIITNGTLAVAPGIPLTNYQGQLTSNKIYFIVTCSNAAPYQAIGMNFVADTLAGTNLPQEDIFLISSPAQLVQSNCEFCIPPADFIHSYLSYGVSSSLTIEFATNFPVDEFIVNVPVDPVLLARLGNSTRHSFVMQLISPTNAQWLLDGVVLYTSTDPFITNCWGNFAWWEMSLQSTGPASNDTERVRWSSLFTRANQQTPPLAALGQDVSIQQVLV